MVVDDIIDDGDLHMSLRRMFLNGSQQQQVIDGLKALPWFRPKYVSDRFGSTCETPCWTNFFGGGENPPPPYQPIPAFLQELSEDVAAACRQMSPTDEAVEFNSVLVRLYVDGNDNIAWHTDARSFLGPCPTIASLSLGASTSFQMRRMHDVWPKGGTAGCAVDTSTPAREWRLSGGDLLVMRGETQQHWHHRVPQERRRGPRFNINFRRILPNRSDTLRGQETFYKYMCHGDCTMESAQRWTFEQILSKRAPLLAVMMAKKSSPARSDGGQHEDGRNDGQNDAKDGDHSPSGGKRPLTAFDKMMVRASKVRRYSH